MTKRIRRSVEQWQTILDRHAASGQSTKAFCETHQLSYAVFCRWRKQLASSDQAPLVELTDLVQGPRRQQWDIELELGDGMTLRLRRG